MSRYPTNEELAVAVEKIATVVRECIAEFKAAAPALVQNLSDEEWSKLKRDENRRRSAKSTFHGLRKAACRRLAAADDS